MRSFYSFVSYVMDQVYANRNKHLPFSVYVAGTTTNHTHNHTSSNISPLLGTRCRQNAQNNVREQKKRDLCLQLLCQRTFGGLHSKLEELLGMLDWVLYELLELPLDSSKTSDIAPSNGGGLDNGLSESGGVALSHSVLRRGGYVIYFVVM